MKASLIEIASKHRLKARFVVIGAWNTIFGYLVFVFLDAALSHVLRARYAAYMTAMVLANVISIANAYAFHKHITFKSKVRGRGIVGEFFRFCTTYLVTFGLNLVLLPTLVEICHFRPRVAGALAIPACTIVSYLGHSRFSFKHDQRRQ